MTKKNKNSAIFESLGRLDEAWGASSQENQKKQNSVAQVNVQEKENNPVEESTVIEGITLLDDSVGESKAENGLRKVLEQLFIAKKDTKTIYIKLSEIAPKIGISYVALMAGKKKLENRGLYKFTRGKGFSAVTKLY